MLADLRHRLRALFRRRAVEQELDDELRFHLDQQIAKHVVAGHAPAEAARRARLELGGLEAVKDDCRDARGVSLVETVAQDLRFGARVLRKSPGFTAIAVLTLALGVGANTALFSIVSGVLLRPLPYPQPDGLVWLAASKPNFNQGSISYPNFLDWQQESRSFAAMAIYRGTDYSLTGGGVAEHVRGELVSADLFTIFGVEPVIGRGFAPGEDRVGAPPVALLGAGLWQRRFGGRADVIGEPISLDGDAYTVVGVVPSSFDLRGGGQPPEIYVPIGQWKNNLLLDRGAGLGIHGVGRLAPAVTLAQARADLGRVTGALALAYPDADHGVGAHLAPLKDAVTDGVRSFLLLLFGAVGLVLLIATINVANLLLARADGRARELAIRVALGAGRGRLLRQLLAEGMLLAVLGGGLGLGFAAWGTSAAVALLPAALPRVAEIAIDGRVLAFTSAISLIAGVGFGLAPMLRAGHPDLHRTIKEGGRGVSGGRQRAQSVFVVAQIALALVLCIGAGLMFRTLSRLRSVDPGYDPADVLTLSVSLPPAEMTASPAAIRGALRQLDDTIAAVPGVEALSLSWGALPLAGDDEQLFWAGGQARPADLTELKWALKYVVEPQYLRALRIPLRRGRFFTERDDEHAPQVAVVDEVFARTYFGDADPLGKRLNLDGHDQPVEIVGVVGHVEQYGLGSGGAEPLQAQLYLPFMQLPDAPLALTPRGVNVVVRAPTARTGLFDAIRAQLGTGDAAPIGFDAQTMDSLVAGSIAEERGLTVLLGAFALLAMLLASVGVYGVISYAVSQRVSEIGVRMALGAQRGDVARLILAQGAKVALVGVAVGLLAAAALTRLMSRLLYGVTPLDPLTFAAVAVVLVVVALAASYVPARRAMRVDPMIALRHE